jgi:hypothetical protein
MENENMTLIPAEEEAIEIAEEVAEEIEETVDEVSAAREQIAQKCKEIKEFCAKTALRIADDLKETKGNPYIRQTHTYKMEIFRKPNDTTPIDSFQMTEVKSYSLRALAIATGIASALFCASGVIVKKLMNPVE